MCFRGGDVSVREFRERGAEAFAAVAGALGSARASAEVGRDFDSGAPVVRGRLSLSSAVMNRSSKLRMEVPILVVPGSAISGTVILSGERETGKVGLTGGVESAGAAVAVSPSGSPGGDRGILRSPCVTGPAAICSASIGATALRGLCLATSSLCHDSLVSPGLTLVSVS